MYPLSSHTQPSSFTETRIEYGQNVMLLCGWRVRDACLIPCGWQVKAIRHLAREMSNLPTLLMAYGSGIFMVAG